MKSRNSVSELRRVIFTLKPGETIEVGFGNYVHFLGKGKGGEINLVVESRELVGRSPRWNSGNDRIIIEAPEANKPAIDSP